MEELFFFRDRFSKLLGVIKESWPYEDSKEMLVRLRLLVYCHIMEADFPYTVFLNLCRIADKREPSWGFFARNADDLLKKEKNGLPIPLRTIDDKISQIDGFALAKDLNFKELMSKIWCNDLRNAFSHSQYAIHPTGCMRCTKHLTGVSGKSAEYVRKRDDCQVDFSFEDVNQFYQYSCDYFDAFKKAYYEAIQPYKIMKCVKKNSGYVYCDNYGIWKPCG